MPRGRATDQSGRSTGRLQVPLGGGPPDSLRELLRVPLGTDVLVDVGMPTSNPPALAFVPAPQVLAPAAVRVTLFALAN